MNKRGMIYQWVRSVKEFSSQYTPNNWSANQIVGEPKFFPNTGDSISTWCPQAYSTPQFIDVEFREKVFVKNIEIYFTLNPNPTTKISAWNEKEDLFVTLLERTPQSKISNKSAIYRPAKLNKVNFSTNRIRIDFDSSQYNYWFEIDSIRLIGSKINDGSNFEKNGFGFVESLTSLEQSQYRMLKEGIHSDVTFACGYDFGDGAKIEVRRVHRMILNEILFFRHLFESDEKKKEFEIKLEKNVTMNSFDAFLEFLYFRMTFRLRNGKDFLDCFNVAKQYQCKEFEGFLKTSFLDFLNIKNVMNLLLEFKELNNIDLNEICFQEIASKFSLFVEEYGKSEIEKLPKPYLLRICALKSGVETLDDWLTKKIGKN